MDSHGSAINDLPQETLFGIFSYLFTPPLTVSKARKIWRVARVCKRWMSLILATGRWWGDIVLNEFDFYDGSTAGNITTTSFLERCIHFSGNHPLSVTISIARGINVDFVRTLQKGSDRLSRLSIEVLTEFARVFEESKVIIDAPNLKHLDIAQLDDFFVDVSDFLAGIQVSPTLSSLTLRHLSLFSVPTDLPWRSITHLALSVYTSDTTLVDLLSKTVNLAYLSLLGVYLERYTPSHVVVLERLSSLTLDTYTSSYLASTIDNLNLPNLQKVHFVYGESSAYKHIMSERLFAHASHCSATVTEVTAEDVSIALGFWIAQFFPNIRELTLEELRPQSQYRSSYANYLAKLPFLQRVCIRSGDMSKEDLRLILTLVAARNKAAISVARIVVHLPILSEIKKDGEHMAVMEELGLSMDTDTAMVLVC